MILFDVESGKKWLSAWRKDLWECCNVGIPDADIETLNVLTFGGLVSWFLGRVRCIYNMHYCFLYCIWVLYLITLRSALMNMNGKFLF